MDRWIQRTVGAVALLPLIGCGLFLAGHAQSSAFLTALGLSSAQFSSSFEGLALGGFVILLVRGVSPVLYLICTVVFISLLVMLASVVLRKRDIRRQIDLDRASRRAPPVRVRVQIDWNAWQMIYTRWPSLPSQLCLS